MARATVVSDPNKPISVISSGAQISQVVTAGTRGPRGVEGKSSYDVWLDQGNTGSIDDYFASLSGGHYTHDQMVPSDVWNIQHDLRFFPNVMTFDSAGTQIIGDVEHIDKNNLVITFSDSNGGKAYLS